MTPAENFRILREHYLDQPNEISLETLALCNAACTFCPYPTIERKGTKMPDELLDRLLTEMEGFPNPFIIAPFKLNEPLLDSRLIPMCERINDRIPQAYLRIFTNGSPLTVEKARQIALLRNVRHLWVSLNAIDASDYEAVMGLKFAQTSKRLDDLHRMDFPHPVVLSKVGGPDERFRMYCHWRWPKFQAVVIKKDAWIDYTDPQIAEIPDTPCSRWFELSVMATGKVALCCMDEGKFVIGDVNEHSLLDIYNQPFWRDRREQMLGRKSVPDPCSRCSY